jgi:ABC-type glycerol-3-phosphate transport system substrate-binding protein
MRTGGVILPIVASVLFLGCARAPDDKTEDGRTIIEYWEKWTGFEGEAMQAVVDAFNASQDRIFVKKLTVSEVDQKLMLAAAGGNPPDLAGLWSYSVPDFAEKGALIPISGLLAEKGITREQYIPVFWDLCEHRGFMWAIPTTPSTVALHFNKRLFREAGLDPERPPRSLAELDEMAEKLTIVEVTRSGTAEHVRFAELTKEERATKDFSIIQLGHAPQEPGWWIQMWGFWFGGDLWDGEQTITASSSENVRALRWIESQVNKYGLENLRSLGASFGNFSSPQNPFLSERVAMVLQGVWMHNFIDKYAPHLEWAAAPFPSEGGEQMPNVTIAECDVLVLPKGCPHVNEAFEFMCFVASQGGMELLNMGQKKFSPLAETSEEFVRDHPNPYIEQFINLARSPNVKTVPRLAFWLEYRDEMQVAADHMLSLTASPESAANHVQDRVQWKCGRVMRRWDLTRKERLQEWSEYDAR